MINTSKINITTNVVTNHNVNMKITGSYMNTMYILYMPQKVDICRVIFRNVFESISLAVGLIPATFQIKLPLTFPAKFQRRFHRSLSDVWLPTAIAIVNTSHCTEALDK